MPWLGRLIDDVDLRLFAIALALGLTGASIGMGFVANAATLFAVLFVFRLTGGSLMSHTAIVTVSRYFTQNRASATGFTSLGVPLAEAILPLAAVATMTIWGWRQAWFIYAVILGAVFVPGVFWLLRSGIDRSSSSTK